MDARLFLYRFSLYLLPASVLLCSFLGLQARLVLADQSGAVVISEVMWMGSDVSTADEWLEIACVGSGTCDLSSWRLTSLKSTGEEATILTFATGTTLVSGDVRIVSHYAASSSRLGLEPWIATSAMSLPNTKLLLRLRDGMGTIRDEVDDGVGNPFAGANPSGGTKASMERIDLGAPGNVPENWRTATESLGFDPGIAIFGTPGIVSIGSSQVSEPSSSSSDASASSRVFDPLLSSSSSSFSSDSSTSSGSSLSSSENSSGSGSSSLSSFSSSETSISSASSESSSSTQIGTSQVEDLRLQGAHVRITEVLANPIGADTDEWIEIGNLGTESVNIAGWSLAVGTGHAYRIPPRSVAEFPLAPGAFVSFRKSVSDLSLTNAGERVSLMSGALLIDAWSYPLTAEEVSYGRDPYAPDSFRAFCVPSEGKANTPDALAPRIVIQDAGSAQIGSAFVMGRDHVSLNLTAEVGAGSLASASCLWDFDDDYVSTSCNPPSHTFPDPGDFTVRLTVRDFCGEISVRTLLVTVLTEEETSDAETISSSSSSRSSSSSSKLSSKSSSLASIVLMSMMESVRVETGVIVSEVYAVPVSRSSQASVLCHGEPCRTMTQCERVPPFDSAQGDTLCGVKTSMFQEEWIELYNPTDRAISLDGWVIDDLKNGGSKPWIIPPRTQMQPGEFRIFHGSETKLKLNDTGDDVWLIAPDGSWSEHVTVPKLPSTSLGVNKAGTSWSLVGGEWCLSDSTPGMPNACRSASKSSGSSASSKSAARQSRTDGASLSPRSPQVGTTLSTRTRYVITGGWPSVSASGISVLTGSQVDLPPSLVTAGTSPAGEKAAEAGAAGGVALLGLALVAVRQRGLWQAGRALLKL